MNRLTKLFLAVLIAGTILAVTYPAIAERAKTGAVKESIGMEISMDGREPFTLSVKAGKERLAFLPVKDAKTPAVKVISWVEDDSLKFKLLAVLDELPAVPTCDNMKELKTEFVASYTAREGESIRVSDFEKLGIAPFKVKALTLTAANACPDGCCCCGGLRCCPGTGWCLECGGCGLCCNG